MREWLYRINVLIGVVVAVCALISIGWILFTVMTPRETYREKAVRQARLVLQAAKAHPGGAYPQDELVGITIDTACWQFLQETLAQAPAYETVLTDLSWQHNDNAPDVRINVRFDTGRRVSFVYQRDTTTGCENIQR